MAQIFLKTLSGDTAVLHDVRTISDLRAGVESTHADIDASDLRLSYASRPLSDVPDETVLSEVGIPDKGTVFVSSELLGGGKKRKKKTYTKPKKIKHKHKTVKLAVLKYYKVNNDGTIERLRKECPAETCGAGVFMAAHPDRVYCGKCSRTYVNEA